MRNCKIGFAILLIVQVSSLVGALPYGHGHPDAETIDVGHHSSQPSRDQYIIEAAIRRGMDGEAVAELLRTKQPVVKVKTDPNGVTKTTTYSLDPDGSISSKTVTEARAIKHYDAGSLPDSVSLDDILKSPTGTVTRTFTDKDGAKVTQTFGVGKPKITTSSFDHDGKDDWIGPHFTKFPSTGFRTSTWSSRPKEDNDWNRPHLPTFPQSIHRPSSWPTGPEDEKEPSNFHEITRTYVGPNGEKRVVKTWSSGPETAATDDRFPSSNWPSFDFPNIAQPWYPTDTLGDPDEWTVVAGKPEVETTTKHKFQSWTPKTNQYPDYSTFETPTTAKPTRTHKVTTPLPSLEDFLKTQYKQTTTTTKTATTPASPKEKTKPPATTKTPVTIKVEDLPISHVLHNGKPADESIIKKLPPHLVPKLNTENVLKIENIHPVEEKVETNSRTLTKTHIGTSKPTLKDLDPQMQEILRNAGISPDDISSIDGDTITKTRREPDGRVITTTYKVHTSPAVTSTYEQVQPPVLPTSIHHVPVKSSSVGQEVPSNPRKPAKSSPIAEFLAKLGLTTSDILAKNGEYTRTFIDDDGQVLTATFILSSPVNANKSHQKAAPKPLK